MGCLECILTHGKKIEICRRNNSIEYLIAGGQFGKPSYNVNTTIAKYSRKLVWSKGMGKERVRVFSKMSTDTMLVRINF